jgi:hypothetical protein
MYKKKRGYKSSKKLRTKTIGFKKRLAGQKRKSKKYNSFRVSRGGIRL